MIGKTLLTPDTVILASGGARGITARCVIKLAQHAPCKFILVGRTSVADPIPDWALDCPQDLELKRRIMTQLTQAGKKATPQAVEAAFRQMRAQQEIESTSRPSARPARWWNTWPWM